VAVLTVTKNPENTTLSLAIVLKPVPIMVVKEAIYSLEGEKGAVSTCT
jgi:hypothetical protein